MKKRHPSPHNEFLNFEDVRNFFEPLTQAIEKQEMDSFNCKPKTVIEVNSYRYNEEENYQNSINQKIKNYALR